MYTLLPRAKTAEPMCFEAELLRKICVLLAALPQRNLCRFYAGCIMQHFPVGIRGVNTFSPRRCINSSCIKNCIKPAYSWRPYHNETYADFTQLFMQLEFMQRLEQKVFTPRIPAGKCCIMQQFELSHKCCIDRVCVSHQHLVRRVWLLAVGGVGGVVNDVRWRRG